MVKITEEEYKCAYKEIYTIIEYLEDDIKEKIPEEKINFYKIHMDENYEFEIDPDKELKNQNILYPTKCILSNLFKNYIATEDDKVLINQKEFQELNEIENKKRMQYNPNELFKKEERKAQLTTSTIKIEEISTDLIKQEEASSIFKKIKDKILKFLKLK